jgi:hypothetical protein
MKMIKACAAGGALLLALAGCSPTAKDARSSASVSSSSLPPTGVAPTIKAVLGTPKVTASATFTLNTVRYASIDSLTELAIVNLTITDNSTTSFAYSEAAVVFAYPDSKTAWTHQNDTHLYGPSPIEDYTPYLPPNPLRAGTLSPGQTVQGLVILRISHKSRYLLYYAASSADLAEWQLTRPDRPGLARSGSSPTNRKPTAPGTPRRGLILGDEGGANGDKPRLRFRERRDH